MEVFDIANPPYNEQISLGTLLNRGSTQWRSFGNTAFNSFSSNNSKLNELWYTVKLTSFQNQQLLSVSIPFQVCPSVRHFVYILWYLYLFHVSYGYKYICFTQFSGSLPLVVLIILHGHSKSSTTFKCSTLKSFSSTAPVSKYVSSTSPVPVNLFTRTSFLKKDIVNLALNSNDIDLARAKSEALFNIYNCQWAAK